MRAFGASQEGEGFGVRSRTKREGGPLDSTLTGPVQGQARKRDPRDRLEKVVAARDGVEPVPARDLADFGPLWAQAREGQVGLQVGQFGKLCAPGGGRAGPPSSQSQRARVFPLIGGRSVTHRPECSPPVQPRVRLEASPRERRGAVPGPVQRRGEQNAREAPVVTRAGRAL